MSIDEMIFSLSEWKYLNKDNPEFVKGIDEAINRLREDPAALLEEVERECIEYPPTLSELKAEFSGINTNLSTLGATQWSKSN
jgi:hypothetical protein